MDQVASHPGRRGRPVNKGAIKFNSIRAMAEAAGIEYMTMYMRLRAGKTGSQAFHAKVRSYRKRVQPVCTVEQAMVSMG